ncbi:reverse transcriptase domain-containing protein [Saccharopolyspora shandongensis]|uniref:reverse transcriptase domain-containing protein n=1 Tax=Saccharopolyspora shandongensis TaxID=418495 RepID=UPI003415CF9A
MACGHAPAQERLSYGYRPGRRAQDAIAEIHKMTTQGYEWVVEGDITACFDNVDHHVLMDLVARRIADRKVCCGWSVRFCGQGSSSSMVGSRRA